MTEVEIRKEITRVFDFARSNGLHFFDAKDSKWIFKDANGHLIVFRWGRSISDMQTALTFIRKIHAVRNRNLPPVVLGQGSYIRTWPKI